MIAIDILREEMEKAHGDLNVWQEDWIVKAMERYAQQQVKNCSIPDVVGRSEQLVAFLEFVVDYKMLEVDLDYEEIVSRFLSN